MFHLYLTHVLAAAGSSNGGVAISDFFNQGLGKIIAALMSVIGVGVVLYAIVKAVKDVAAGKMGPAIRTIILATIFSAFLFDPALIGGVVDGLTNVATGIVNLFSSKTAAGA